MSLSYAMAQHYAIGYISLFMLFAGVQPGVRSGEVETPVAPVGECK
jgi:hypothetical protein